LGRKSRFKREFRKKYPGGWKEYWHTQKPSTWSFSDGLAGFSIPEDTSFLGGIALFALAVSVAAVLDVLALAFKRRRSLRN
jgi:hypothetical protein